MNLEAYEPEIRLVESNVDGIHDLFTNRENVHAWLHDRMLRFLCPITAAYPKASWLTVGDEGLDGWMLRQYGAAAVTASSISDVRLKKAMELGYLPGIDVRALNAEQLDLPDDAFDFVLCRQAYHHVRRAPLAFYEFMRVARSGFILIEPMESPSTRPLDAVRTLAKILLRGRRPEYDEFEPAGNFIYRISERDVFRMLAAVGLEWFAIKTFNTFYLPWIAERRSDSLLAQVPLQLGIGVQNLLSSCRLMSPGLCVVFVATGPGADAAREALRAAHFRIVTIPKNPYMAGQDAQSRESVGSSH
jgi:SAM-dependent methyltransferase